MYFNSFDVCENYDQVVSASMPYYGSIHQAISFEVAKCIRPFDSVIEIGCGTGTLAKKLVNVFESSFDLYLIDSSRHMLDVAERRLQASRSDVRLEYVISDMHYIDWSVFDIRRISCIYEVMCLSHAKDILSLKQILSSAKSVMAKGGTIIIGEKMIGQTSEARECFHAMIDVRIEILARQSGLGPEYAERLKRHLIYEDQYYDMYTWSCLLQELGFEVKKLYGIPLHTNQIDENEFLESNCLVELEPASHLYRDVSMAIGVIVATRK